MLVVALQDSDNSQVVCFTRQWYSHTASVVSGSHTRSLYNGKNDAWTSLVSSLTQALTLVSNLTKDKLNGSITPLINTSKKQKQKKKRLKKISKNLAQTAAVFCTLQDKQNTSHRNMAITHVHSLAKIQSISIVT